MTTRTLLAAVVLAAGAALVAAPTATAAPSDTPSAQWGDEKQSTLCTLRAITCVNYNSPHTHAGEGVTDGFLRLHG
ncbi:hypothetical protein ACE1OC_00120 [Streptomyces sp. DSM 116496]|uniref:hypothetical protein n=1 Tax=Streptomyces stoeckheimensis TaxID=3344656 RepID=UPI0038B41562